MKKLFIIFLFLITACNKNIVNKNNLNDINYSEKMSLNEFILRLENYSQNSPYPNIDD